MVRGSAGFSCLFLVTLEVVVHCHSELKDKAKKKNL